MPQIIIAIIVIALLWALLNGVFNLVVLSSINFIALLDRIIGSLNSIPALSWAISGIIIGTVTSFAFIESRKLYRQSLKPFLTIACIGFFITNFVLTQNRLEARSREFASSQTVASTYGTVISEMNLRSSPSTNSNVVVKIRRGASVTILDSYNEWLKVRYDNYEGYVKQKYVRK